MSTFKALALAGAAVLSSMGLASAAEPPVAPVYLTGPLAMDGFVSAAMGRLDAEGETVPRTNVRGSVATMLNPTFGVQVDALGDLASVSGSSLGAIDTAVHAYHRTPGHLIGAFVQWRGIGGGTGSIDVLFGGAEFQLTRNAWLLSAQIAAQHLSDSTGTTASGWIVTGIASYFHTPNWRFDAEIAFDHLGGGSLGSGDITSTIFGAGTEFRFNNPLSVFAQYEHIIVSGDTTSGNVNLIWLGAKWNIGAPTLHARAVGGASLNPVPGIIAYIR